MTALDPTPWPASSLAEVRADPCPMSWSVSVAMVPVPALDVTVTIDQRAQPAGTATFTVPSSVAGGWSVTAGLSVEVRAGYGHDDQPIFRGIITEITDTAGYATARAETVEIIHRGLMHPYSVAAWSPAPANNTMPKIVAAMRIAGIYPDTIPVDLEGTWPTAAAIADWPNVVSAGGDMVIDTWRELAELSGLWWHVNPKTGLWRSDAYPTGFNPAAAITLSRDGSQRSLITGYQWRSSVDDWCDILDVTTQWDEAGTTKYSHRTFGPSGAGALHRVQTWAPRIRPPLTGGVRAIPAGWAPAVTTLARLTARTWTATLTGRACWWLNLADHVRATDPHTGRTIEGVIAAIDWTLPAGVQTLTVRPN